MKLLKHGSVKDIYQGESDDRLIFTFSDRYSVFDWGPMPDTLKNKAKTLGVMCSLLFKELSDPESWKKWFKKEGIEGPLAKELLAKGVQTHFISALDDQMKEADIFSMGDSILVERCHVPQIPFVNGRYDYEFYKEKSVDTLVPLEVIFRHGLPSGSSLFDRLEDSAYRKELGIEGIPKQGAYFDRPLIEFSTKLEHTDRYISRKDAMEMAGMSDGEMAKLIQLTEVLALRLKSIFNDIGVCLWDGKFEFAFIQGEKERDFKLVDSMGPDEVRLTLSDIHLSKEMLRQFYRTVDWADCVKKAKAIAKERKESHWQKICTEELKSSPPLLPKPLKEKGEFIYQSICNALSYRQTGKKIFDAPELSSLVEQIQMGHVVIVGSGGREHALAWKMAQSEKVRKVTVIPGNEGMLLTKKVAIEPSEGGDIVKNITRLSPDLVVIGPEKYLVQGLADKLRESRIPVFGPSKEASVLESSKSFAKEVLKELGLPTAPFKVASSLSEAQEIIGHWPNSQGLVVKADELAAGKGVFVCQNKKEALEAAQNLLANEKFAIKSQKIIIEEKLEGQELSSFYLCNGHEACYLASAKDYKRVEDFDKGPNTGGMGCYVLNDGPNSEVKRALDDVADKVIKYMKKRGTPFQGVLFVGSMIVNNKPFVLEFNVRFGDPETQAILPAFDNDFFEMIDDIVKGKIPRGNTQMSCAVHVVASSKGYPALNGTALLTEKPLFFEDEKLLEGGQKSLLFMAGVKKKGETFLNNGGRVFGITTIGGNIEEAREENYEKMAKISFEGMHYRKDIALKEKRDEQLQK